MVQQPAVMAIFQKKANLHAQYAQFIMLVQIKNLITLNKLIVDNNVATMH